VLPLTDDCGILQVRGLGLHCSEGLGCGGIQRAEILGAYCDSGCCTSRCLLVRDIAIAATALALCGSTSDTQWIKQWHMALRVGC
jgi:hypothetical protein